MTADQFYNQYGNGRSRTQFDADCNAFFGALSTANAKPITRGTRAHAVRTVLANTRAMGPHDTNHGTW